MCWLKVEGVEVVNGCVLLLWFGLDVDLDCVVWGMFGF